MRNIVFKRSKKFSVSLIISLLLMTTIAFAYPYWTTYSSWSSAQGSYSPYTGSVRTDSYFVSGTSDTVTVGVSGVKYSSSAISAITNYYNQNTWYPGIDVTEITSTPNLTSTGYWSTNYPSPKFDSDDDDWNGSSEETEITILAPWNMTTGTNYYYTVQFKEFYNASNSYSGTFAVTSSESKKQLTEYNTQLYNQLTTVSYKTP